MELMRSTLTLLKSLVSSIAKNVAFKAPKTSSKSEKKVPYGTQPGAKTRRRRKSTSSSTKHNPLSKIKATKSASLSKEPLDPHLAI
ncbi:hypothetical protein Tco_0263830 [Tanacetum coccineum]